MIKAVGIAALWLLSATPGVAAPAVRHAHARTNLSSAQSEAAMAKDLARHSSNVGSSKIRVRKVGSSLLTRRAHFQRNIRQGHCSDDDAIQNDAPAAYTDVALFLELRRLGLSVENVDPQLFTIRDSPRSPRGPPATA